MHDVPQVDHSRLAIFPWFENNWLRIRGWFPFLIKLTFFGSQLADKFLFIELSH